MAMGTRKKQEQGSLWVQTGDIAKSPGHPFYEKLNKLLDENDFDRFAEGKCRKYYAKKMGRPSIPSAVYFRMLFIGYFEGIDSERGIAWRCKDSLALRSFLSYSITETTPDHSSVSRTRRLIDLETHREVFTWVLKVLAKQGLLKGKTLGVDATTLEANAAMRSIVRRDTGEEYNEFLERIAEDSGIETPTREDLARMDKKRKKKTSNKDWENPNDPDAKVTKMKDGRTRMGHKSEHAVDLDTGAILAVNVTDASKGDTESLFETLVEAQDQMEAVSEDPECEEAVSEEPVKEVVTDKGYQSNEVVTVLRESGVRSYIPEQKPKRRRWKGKESEKKAFHANRIRVRGRRGRRLLRKRAELVERSFAHGYDSGGMRKTHLRSHGNILKRLLVHIGAFNLGLVMRKLMGFGKPREITSRFAEYISILRAGLEVLNECLLTSLIESNIFKTRKFRVDSRFDARSIHQGINVSFATGS